MAVPPFTIATTVPGDNGVISQFPSQERPYRDTVWSWLNILADPATGKLKDTAFPEPVEIVLADDGAGQGPTIALQRDSVTPTASDTLGGVEFRGKDSAGNDTLYAVMNAGISVATDGSERGNFNIMSVRANNVADTSNTLFRVVSATTSAAAGVQSNLAVTNLYSSSSAAGGIPTVMAWSTNRNQAVGFGCSTAGEFRIGSFDGTGAFVQSWGGVTFANNFWTATSTVFTNYADGGSFRQCVIALNDPGWGNQNYLLSYHQLGVWAGMLIGIANGTIQYQFRNDGGAYSIGGGAWIAYSDERIKDIHGPYEPGLDAILALEPISFTYKGNDQPSLEQDSFHKGAAEMGKVFAGLSAQKTKAHLPNAVSVEPGYIDGVKVDDLHKFDPGELPYALINAVKELNAKVEALEAKLRGCNCA